MRDYAKVSPQFWIGSTGKALRKAGPEAQIVAFYLMTCPLSNMLGLFYLPETYIQHETGLGQKGASKGLAGAIEAGFCKYDPESEMIWVIEMATYQIAENLEETDKRSKGVQNDYDKLPDNPFLREFYDKYHGPFKMPHARGGTIKKSTIEAPYMPLASQEQEQEQEQENKQEQEQASLSPQSDDESAVFTHWQTIMGHKRAQFDEKRRKMIRHWLKTGYTKQDLLDAVTGCSYTPHNMGHNDRGERYDSLELILRDTAHIDRFMAAKARPPRPGGRQSLLEAGNAAVVLDFIGDNHD